MKFGQNFEEQINSTLQEKNGKEFEDWKQFCIISSSPFIGDKAVKCHKNLMVL